ncbi:MAG: DUF2273 domain-containing protein [Christensenella sp.]|uniref:DUF2273 domain-containing protein n=1 Tax=Christensenella sp. TaxID=1935934 RepID=UPI002B1EC3A9|nr:DUF2273 domain-containing protein [Christensenella sp.]MEA5004595.1 DUF2273 domain-containing protein [Christensenella sp.]
MKEKFLEWLNENKGLFWGIVIGLAVAILFLTIGFWATLLIAICVGIGAFLGSRPDIRALIGEWFLNLFNKKN